MDFCFWLGLLRSWCHISSEEFLSTLSCHLRKPELQFFRLFNIVVPAPCAPVLECLLMIPVILQQQKHLLKARQQSHPVVEGILTSVDGAVQCNTSSYTLGTSVLAQAPNQGSTCEENLPPVVPTHCTLVHTTERRGEQSCVILKGQDLPFGRAERYLKEPLARKTACWERLRQNWWEVDQKSISHSSFKCHLCLLLIHLPTIS